MRYMQLSEQIVSMISLGSAVEGEKPTAGGFVVQLLPEAAEAEAAMETMTRRLEDFVEIRERLQKSDGSPSQLIEQIFEGMPFTWLDSNDIRFGCQCSEVRVMTTLSVLNRSDIQELVDEGRAAEHRLRLLRRRVHRRNRPTPGSFERELIGPAFLPGSTPPAHPSADVRQAR